MMRRCSSGATRFRAAVVDRDRFDGLLGDGAVAAGAEVRTGARVTHLDVDGSGTHVRLALGGAASVTARACVLACGASYRFTRQLSLGVPRVLVQSAQVEVPHPPHDHVEVYLGNVVAPGGFGWLVPFHRRGQAFAKVGLTCDRRADVQFATRGRGRACVPCRSRRSVARTRPASWPSAMPPAW